VVRIDGANPAGATDSRANLIDLVAGKNGLRSSARQLVLHQAKANTMWQWPAGIIDVYLPRLRQTGVSPMKSSSEPSARS